MIYYNDGKLIIRSMEPTDARVIYDEYNRQNWHPKLEIYENYYIEQESGKRVVFVAEYDGCVAGYTTLLPEAAAGPFCGKGIPEISDFSVFINYRCRGIGNTILDTAEACAAKTSGTVSLGVGLHSGYGAAQRIYAKRGYIPDGSGVWFREKNLEQYADCQNDDSLILYMSKKLRD